MHREETMYVHSEKAAHYQIRKAAARETQSAYTLILDIQLSEQ